MRSIPRRPAATTVRPASRVRVARVGYAPVGHVDLTLSGDETVLEGRGPGRRTRDSRRFRHRTHDEPRPLHRPRPRRQSAGRDDLHGRGCRRRKAAARGWRSPCRCARRGEQGACGGDGQCSRVAQAPPRVGDSDGGALRARRRAMPCAACGAPLRRCRPRHPTPGWWPNAKSRHGSSASHERQTRLATSIWSTAGPVVPTGKKRSGSVLRQAATRRQSSASQSTVRFHMRAIGMCLHQHCDPIHMIGPLGCPSVNSGLTEKRVMGRRRPGKEFFVKFGVPRQWIRETAVTQP